MKQDMNLQVGFYLQDEAQRSKMKELAKSRGLGVSALMRTLILEKHAEVFTK
jgi:hypothetical protein